MIEPRLVEENHEVNITDADQGDMFTGALAVLQVPHTCVGPNLKFRIMLSICSAGLAAP